MSGTAIATRQIKDNAVTAAKCASDVIIADGSNAFAGDQSMGGHLLTNVADPISATDAVNKRYVDSGLQGMDQKTTARVVTTAALPANTYSNGTSGVGATLTGNSNGALSAQNGVTLVVDDYILVNNEVNQTHNGLYVVTQVGDGSHPYILTRSVDCDASSEFSGALVPVGQEGTLYPNSVWLSNWNASFATGTSNVTFINLAAANTYTGSNGITVTGTVIAPTYGSTANTICQGNDSRLSDARTPVGTALADGKIWVGNVSNQAAAVTPSGDVTMSNAGAFTAASTIAKYAKFITRETPSGTVNGSNAAFTLANTPQSGTEQVFVNGVLQDPGSGNDYTISGTTITFETAAIPQSGDKVRVTYISQ